MMDLGRAQRVDWGQVYFPQLHAEKPFQRLTCSVLGPILIQRDRKDRIARNHGLISYYARSVCTTATLSYHARSV